MRSKTRKSVSLLLAVALAFGALALIPLSVTSAAFTTTPMIAAGSNHNLALRSDGTVWAWGNNSDGQLGDGTNTDSSTPVRVMTAPGLDLNSVVAIAANGRSSLALKSDGTVWAWGNNWYGQLGDGTSGYTTGNRPAQVMASPGVPFSGVTAISAGGNHNLVLKGDGTVWAWGKNYHGQLGNGTTTQSSCPVQVMASPSVPLNGVITIAAESSYLIGNSDFSCALKNDGTVWAWGSNSDGQLGNGTSDYSSFSSSPIQVLASPGVPLTGVTFIVAGGGHAMALKSDGAVWAWGQNNSGQLGNGTTTSSNWPVQTMISPGVELSGITAISDNLVLKNDGTVFAWGAGPLGDGTDTGSNWPVQVMASPGVPLSGVMGVSRSIALKSDGTVWSWGITGWSEDGTTPIMDCYPVQVPGYGGEGWLNLFESVPFVPRALTVVNGTGSGSYGVDELISITAQATLAGKVFDKWTATAGTIMNPTKLTTTFIMPASTATVTATYKSVEPPLNLTTTPMVAAGVNHSLALKSDGTVWAWGNNSNGALGVTSTTQSSLPVQVLASPGVPLSGVVGIAAGDNYSLALKSDGTVWAWGTNDSGQLGNGTTTQSSWPVQVMLYPGVALSGVTAIVAGYSSYALKSDGTVWGWGASLLGNGTNASSSRPVQVMVTPGVALIGVTAISNNLALKSDGTVWAWGDNYCGQLGNGTSGYNTGSNWAMQVMASSGVPFAGVTAISAESNHKLALKSDGTVWAWGRACFDDPSTLPRYYVPTNTYPMQVMASPGAPLTGVTAINHSIALKSDGTVLTWEWTNIQQNSSDEYGAWLINLSKSTQVSGLSSVTSISGGSWDYNTEHLLALKNDGTVWAWRGNGFGQLGDGTTTRRDNPVQVLAPGAAGYLNLLADQPTTYTLTVNSGMGGGNYEAGAVVTITASTAPAGKVFDKWTVTGGGMLANANSATTTFTMPANAATVTVTYKNEDVPTVTYALAVVGGTGSGDYAAGTSVAITADEPPEGKVFDKWTTTAGSFADANKPNTTFTMPTGTATVTANYKDAPAAGYIGLFGMNTKFEATPLNWFLFYVCFGWLWMWFI